MYIKYSNIKYISKAMVSFGGRKTPSSGKSRGPKNKQQSGSGKKKSGKKKKEVKKDVVAKSSPANDPFTGLVTSMSNTFGISSM